MKISFKKILLSLVSLVCSAQFVPIFAIESKMLASEAELEIVKISLEDRDKMFMAIEDRNLATILQLHHDEWITLDPRAYYRTKPLHKAIESKDLKIVQILLGLSKSLDHYDTECLLDAYAYAQQHYDFIKSRPTEPMYDAKDRLIYQENFIYKEDLEICQFLQRRVQALGITTDYRTVDVYIPERDEARFSILWPRLRYAAGSNIKFTEVLRLDACADVLCAEEQTSENLATQTQAKLENWSGCEIKKLTFTGAIDIDQASFGPVPELAEFDSIKVNVGPAVIAAQLLRPLRTEYPYEAPMHPRIVAVSVAPEIAVESPVCTQNIDKLFDELEQAGVDQAARSSKYSAIVTSASDLNKYLCGSITALTVAVLAMVYSYYN